MVPRDPQGGLGILGSSTGSQRSKGESLGSLGAPQDSKGIQKEFKRISVGVPTEFCGGFQGVFFAGNPNVNLK